MSHSPSMLISNCCPNPLLPCTGWPALLVITRTTFASQRNFNIIHRLLELFGSHRNTLRLFSTGHFPWRQRGSPPMLKWPRFTQIAKWKRLLWSSLLRSEKNICEKEWIRKRKKRNVWTKRDTCLEKEGVGGKGALQNSKREQEFGWVRALKIVFDWKVDLV